MEAELGLEGGGEEGWGGVELMAIRRWGQK